MPLDETGNEPSSSKPDGGGSKKTPMDQKKRERILIIVAVVGVIIAYLTLKSMSKKSTPSVATTGYTVTPNSAGGYMTQQQAQLTGIDTELSRIIQGQQLQQTQITTLQKQVTGLGHGPSSTTPTASGTPSNGQQAYRSDIVTAGALGQLDVIGSSLGGGQYSGWNEGVGAPVYANVNGQWVLGANFTQLTSGTQVAVPKAYEPYISNFQSNEHL